MFDFFKKKKSEETNKMSTLEEVRKAYEDLTDEDKKAFHQSLADRVHESVAAQEEHKGETDAQTAADREHEALGEEHAEEAEKAVKKVEEDGETPAEAAQEEAGEDGDVKRVLADVLKRLEAIEKRDPLDGKREKYGLSPAAQKQERPAEVYDEKKINAILGR